MRARRRVTWCLEPAGGDLYDVLRNGRRLRSNLVLRAARAYIAARKAPADTVVLVEADGYARTVSLTSRPTEET